MEINKITFQYWRRKYELKYNVDAPLYGFEAPFGGNSKIEIVFFGGKTIIVIEEVKYIIEYTNNYTGSIFKVHDSNKKLIAEYSRFQKWIFIKELILKIHINNARTEWDSNYMKFRRKNHILSQKDQSIEYTFKRPTFIETLKDYFAKTYIEVESTKKLKECLLEICLGIVISEVETDIANRNN